MTHGRPPRAHATGASRPALRKPVPRRSGNSAERPTYAYSTLVGGTKKDPDLIIDP